MNILHVSVHLGGGVGKAISGMITQIKDQCEQVLVLLEKPQKDTYCRLLLKEDIKVCICPQKDQMSLLIEWADVVVINWWGHPLMVKFITQMEDYSCRLLVWCHINGCAYPYLPFDFLNKFNRILFTSSYSYENLLWTDHERSIIQSKSDVVYGMGDFRAETFPILKKETDDFVIGYVGTLNYSKINSNFIDFCKAVQNKIPQVQFIMVGDLDQRMIKDVKDHELEDHFIFTGYTDNVEQYYKKMNVFGYLLQPSTYATTENVLLEAMAYGLPIVVLSNDVEKNIIKSEENGYVVQSKEQYADLIEFLFKNPKHCEMIGRKAHDYAVQEYSLIKNVNRFLYSCQKVFLEKKKRFFFKNLIGASPYEWLGYFSGDNKQLFDRLLKDDVCCTKGDDYKIDMIYTQKSKGSILQFNQYFNDEKLKIIENRICGNEDE